MRETKNVSKTLRNPLEFLAKKNLSIQTNIEQKEKECEVITMLIQSKEVYSV